MPLSDEEVKKLLKRMKHDQIVEGDGKQFMEYLAQLSFENYEAFKTHTVEMNDIHKGYALCVDFLIESFANCEKEAVKTEQDELAEEAYR